MNRQDQLPRRFRQRQLPDIELQPSLFSEDERDLLDAIADQATDADYEATADLLKRARDVQS